MGGHDDAEPTGNETRRTFLRAMGAASAVAGVGGLAGAQETTEEGEETTTEEDTTTEGDETATTETEEATDGDATTVALGGRTSGWYGLAPAAITGEENPTLALRDGERYRVVWMNLDGEQHELRLEDEDGEALERTDSASEVGETREVVFEASESLAAYRCEYHPEQMVGDVELGEGFETTEETETPTEDGETETETEGDGEVVDVAVGPDGQYLRFVPEEVEISVGDTVRWTAESEGHNVSAKPDADPKVEIPDDAEPFSTYEGSRSFMVMEVGETFEHTFTVPGTYVYVCTPHADQGMVGTVVVTE
ncbi:plastocyanin/azurin family copper-binding protein [Halorussus salilacus]|uniref:plastocyanin/azurin family copper-binding protein n=1 Tax=Halorussus salilacus TaxID=2953750 RepID=UPI00209D1C3E|nr:plastocyanin/azurin family copper-binding protein [Halorussus salilacus]USZ67940.1 plastocyanin/azurin family copper-binding protein [Halorussus salilacus]